MYNTSILQRIEERQKYLDSMVLYSEELSKTDSLRQEKEEELEKLLGKEETTLILSNINSNLESGELPIPVSRIPDMNDTDRRRFIIKIAQNIFITNELNKNISALIQK